MRFRRRKNNSWRIVGDGSGSGSGSGVWWVTRGTWTENEVEVVYPPVTRLLSNEPESLLKATLQMAAVLQGGLFRG